MWAFAHARRKPRIYWGGFPTERFSLVRSPLTYWRAPMRWPHLAGGKGQNWTCPCSLLLPVAPPPLKEVSPATDILLFTSYALLCASSPGQTNCFPLWVRAVCASAFTQTSSGHLLLCAVFGSSFLLVSSLHRLLGSVLTSSRLQMNSFGATKWERKGNEDHQDAFGCWSHLIFLWFAAN